MNAKLLQQRQEEEDSERDLEEFEEAEKSAKEESRDEQESAVGLNIPSEVIDREAQEIEVEMKKVESIHSNRTEEDRELIDI